MPAIPSSTPDQAFRESPWPSEKILELLGDHGIPVASGLLRDDLLLLAASTLGCPPIPFDGVAPVVSAAPAHPAKARGKAFGQDRKSVV